MNILGSKYSIAILLAVFVLGGVFILPEHALADTDTTKENVCDSSDIKLPGCDNTSGTTYQALTNKWLPNAITGFIAFTGIAAVILIMVAGVMYILSMGNEEKEKKARKIIYFALMGLIITILAYAIVQIVINLQFGTNAQP